MSTFPLILAVFLGSILYLFVYWRRLREDYSSSLIFESGFLYLLGVLVGVFVSQFIFSKSLVNSYFFDKGGLWFWGGVIGFTVSFLLGTYIRKIRFYESFEAAGVGMLYLVFLVLLILPISQNKIANFLPAAIAALTLALYYFLDKRYKSFSWYKSGRVGFSGLTAFGVFFLARAVVAVLSPHMISFVGIIDAVLSAVIAFLAFFNVYNLSQ